MIILKESTALQTVKFVPTRLDIDANYLFLTNETTNETTSFQINVFRKSFYSYFKKAFALKASHFYTIELKYYGVIDNKLDYHLVHRDKIFCTNQDIDTFSVNKDQYVPKGDTIIFYE